MIQNDSRNYGSWPSCLRLAARDSSAGSKKPNRRDHGRRRRIWNISAYTAAIMGGSTPNIDRIAKRAPVHRLLRSAILHGGTRRGSFTGQTPFRTGLLKVGIPLPSRACGQGPTIARAFKPRWLRHGADRQNHLGDPHEYLPPSTASMSLWHPLPSQTP